MEKVKRTKKTKKLIDLVRQDDDSDEEVLNPPKGRDFDLNQIRSELKGFSKAVKVANPTDSSEKDAVSSDDSATIPEDKIKEEVLEVEEMETPMETEKSVSSDDIYEFKEPEPFEFESRKSAEEKSKKRIIPRVLDDEKSSPKKKPIKSPIKVETPVKEPTVSTSSGVEEKKWFKRTPVKKIEEPEPTPPPVILEEKVEVEEIKKPFIEDPFDKLVESPSFQIVKTCEKTYENKEKVVRNLINEDSETSIKEEANTTEDERIDTSDNDDFTSESVFQVKDDIFSDSNSSLRSPEPKNDNKDDSKEDKKKDVSDEDDPIRESIKRIVTNPMSDEESNDALLMVQTPTPTCSFDKDPKPMFPVATPTILKIEPEEVETKVEQKEPSEVPTVQVKEKAPVLPKQISPVFQETDSSLLEEMCAIPQIIPPKVDDFKEINVKTGPKIADSLLQKLSMIKKPEPEVAKKPEPVIETPLPPPLTPVKTDAVEESKQKIEEEKPKLKPVIAENKPKKPEIKPKTPEIKTKTPETSPPKPVEKPKIIESTPLEYRKRSPRSKVLSREFIEDDTDSDSSGSEERLIIARSDDESQNSFTMDNKPDIKESDSNNSLFKSVTDDSQLEEERNFMFDSIKKPEIDLLDVCEPADTPSASTSANIEKKSEVELSASMKDEEPDSHLHSMLYCEETIPGSPAPPPSHTINDEKPKSKSIHEMPFASAPCSSNNKNILNNPEVAKGPDEQKSTVKVDGGDEKDMNAAIDNSPPTTPESTLSNLSPRG